MDSYSIKTTEKGPKGYDKAKNVKGRKRHILVDTMGLLMRVCVHAADIQEREETKLLVWADSGYRGEPCAEWVRKIVGVAWTS